ncbi:acyltransferase family protein [Methylolobus aquaticus]
MADCNYRPDIDGLRAVAIIPVVAFHAGVPLFGGGFVGVDVFFVISGFLITRLLADELGRTGRIDFLAFYARRARRLFPALAVVCLATLALGLWALLPFGEQQDLAKSAIATSLFSSNLFFWMQSGYFDGPTDLKPLLNMWSLAVEEQFYWVWPLLLVAVWRGFIPKIAKGARTLVFALALIAAVSFGSNLWVTAQSPSTAFYMMPIRAWEFALGGTLAFFPSSQFASGTGFRKLAPAAGVMGLGLIGWSVYAFTRATPFPGSAALIPVCGTALVIFSGHSGQGVVFRLLSLPVIVTVGLWSYSWYLWHWPLLALARAYTFGEHHLWRDLALAVVALGLAALTYRFVENPVRRGRAGPFATTRGSMVAGSGLLILVLASAAGLGAWAKYKAQSSALGAAIMAAMRDREVVTRDCDTDFLLGTFKGNLPPIQKCQFGGKNQRILLWGDSFAEHYSPLLDRLGRKHGLGFTQRLFGGCPPILGVVPVRSGMPHKDCADFNDRVAEELPQFRAKGFDAVILSADWLMQDPLPIGGALRFSADDAINAFSQGLTKVLTESRVLGFKSLLIAPSVEFPISVPLCLGRQSAERCGVARAEFEARRQRIMNIMRAAVNGKPSVRLYDPVASLCGPTNCSPILNDVIAYRDTGHLAASALPVLQSDFDLLLRWLVKQ